MVATTSLLYRMGIEGDEKVRAAVSSIGSEEEKSAARAVAAADKKADRVAAVERMLTSARNASAQADQKAYAMLTGTVEEYEGAVRRAGAAERDSAADAKAAAALRSAAFAEAFNAVDPANSLGGKSAAASASVFESAFSRIDANVAALRRADAAMSSIGKSAAESAAVFGQAFAEMETRASRLRASIDPAHAAQVRFDREMKEARSLISQGAISLDEYTAKLRLERAALQQASTARRGAIVSTGQMRAASQQLSYQIGDVTQQMALGVPAMTIFAQQGGQVVQAFSLMNKGGNKFLNFIGGPWGAVITGGALIVGMLTSKLLDNKDAADAAAEGLRNFQQRQSDIGNFIDTTTGKLKEQNRTLVLNAILTRKAEMADNEKAIRDSRDQALDAARKRASDPGTQAGLGRSRLGILRSSDDVAVSRALKNANGDVEKLADNLARMAETRPGLKDLALKVSELGGTAILAKRDNEELAKELRALSGDTSALTKGSASLIEKQVALSTATTNVGRARAAYNLVLARGSEAEKQGGVALEQYKADLTAASTALHAAEAAEKGANAERHEGAKALKEAARQAKEYARDIASLEDKYMPAAAAARRYREELARIAELQGAGQIDAGSADLFRRGARTDYLKTRAALLGDAIGIDGIRADADAEQRQIDAENQRRQRAAQILADERAGMVLTQRQLELVGANDEYRTAELAKLRVIQNLQRDRIPIESEFGQQIISTAAAHDALIAQLRHEEAIWGEITGYGEHFVDSVLDVRNWDDWGEAGRSILRDLEQEFLRLAALNPIKNMLFGSDLPTMSGVLGKLFAGGGVPIPTGNDYSALSAVLGIGRNAAGTQSFAGGLTLLGEHGPELGELPAGTRIHTASDTRRMLAANDRGEQRIALSITLDGEMLDARIDNRAANISVDVVRAAAPRMLNTASAKARRDAARPVTPGGRTG